MSEGLLTKMSVHGCNLNNVAGGQVEISQYDIAASLSYGQLPQAAYQLARAKYLDDIKSIQWVKQHLIQCVTNEIENKNLSYTDERATGIAELLIREQVFGISCNKCDGLGFNYSPLKSKPNVGKCKKCHGTGIGLLSERERARIANVPYTTWNRKWKEQLVELFHYLHDLDREVIRHVKRQFYSDDE